MRSKRSQLVKVVVNALCNFPDFLLSCQRNRQIIFYWVGLKGSWRAPRAVGSSMGPPSLRNLLNAAGNKKVK